MMALFSSYGTKNKQHIRRGGGGRGGNTDKHASRWRINRGICHRNRSLCVTTVVIISVYPVLTCISALTVVRKGWQAGEGLPSGPHIGAQRHYRPPYSAWFIHKYQRIAISQQCIISQSQRNPRTTSSTSLYSSKQYDNPDTFSSQPPSPSPLSCWLPIWLCGHIGNCIQFTRLRWWKRIVSADMSHPRG